MDLGKISIDPRLRNGWQAVDLGFAMARQWWRAAFLVWALPAFAFYLLLSVFFFERAWLILLLVWWLKPLWDRLPLALASRALFGETPDIRRTLWESWKTFKPDALASLTWRRLSPSRSFDLPVTVLEGLRGEDRTRRIGVLHQSYGNAATWLTLLLVHVELFLALGCWSALALLVPQEWDISVFALMTSEDNLANHLSNLITFTAMALVGPFYSMAGFSLYICRRIELEGWDIEIRFRHLAERQGRSRLPSGRGIAAACLLGLATMGVGHSSGSWAGEAEPAVPPPFLTNYYDELEQSPDATEAKQDIVATLGGEDFHRIETISGWRFKTARDSDESDPAWVRALIEFFGWLADLAAPLGVFLSAFAGGFEIFLWLLVAAILVWLLYRYRDGLLSLFAARPQQERNRPPDVLFGLDVRRESLPEDICGQVQEWWRQGRQREALGLLYRATLSRLIHQFSFEFAAGYTEQECVSVVRRGSDPAVSDFLARLTRSWQRLAYAHSLPASSQVEALCAEWQQLFQGEAKHAR